MEKDNKVYDTSPKIYGTKSIKFRLTISAVLILAISVFQILLSTYSFEMYFKQIDYYSTSYYELINFRNGFNNMCQSAENYIKDEKNEDLENFNAKKEILDNTAKKLESEYTVMDDDEQKALIHAICNSYKNYSNEISSIIISNDTVNYYEKYSDNSVYIDNYIEVLLNARFIQGQVYHENIQKKMNIFKVIEISAFIFLLTSIFYIIIVTFNQIVKPVLVISAYSQELAQGKLDIGDIDDSQLKHDDEIKNLVVLFNKMKQTMREMIKVNNENNLMHKQLNEVKKNVENAMDELISAKSQNEILFKKANYDNLTGIFNRNAFENNVRQSLENFKDDSLGALMVIDIDNFKMVNDTLGHQGGDEVLKLLARCLTNILADCGFVGRWGGDEFVGFITHADNIEFINKKASDLCKIMNRKFMFKGIIHDISISVGVCPMTKGYELKKAYEHSDKMLYDVKEMGRNNYKVYIEDLAVSVNKEQ